MMKYLRHMAVFARIVECGSISAAADDLNRSKSVISQQLKSLEQELGVALLNRTTRRQVLTPAGRDFYQQCLRINSIGEQAWQNARETQQLPAGSVRISAPCALIEPVVAPAIGTLVARHSRIEPTLLAEDLRVDLIEDEVDLAIRVGDMPASDYKQRLLGRFSEVLCASPDYIHRLHLTPDRLVAEPELQRRCDYIANSWQGTEISHRCRHRRNGESAELRFHASRFCNSLHSVIAMARAGAGLALIPERLLKTEATGGELINVLDNYHFATVPVYAVHAFGHKPPLPVRLSIEAIAGLLQQLPTTEPT